MFFYNFTTANRARVKKKQLQFPCENKNAQ